MDLFLKRNQTYEKKQTLVLLIAGIVATFIQIDHEGILLIAVPSLIIAITFLFSFCK
jgi:hypothetical protein